MLVAFLEPEYSLQLSIANPAHLPPPELVKSGVGSLTSEWMLVGVIGSHELGTPERVAQLEKMKQRKTDHGETYLAADVVSVGHPKLLLFPSFSCRLPLSPFSPSPPSPPSPPSLFSDHSGSY